MKPSADKVLRVLRLRGADGATELDIWRMARIASGAQRIHDLRRAGYAITTEYETTDGMRYARWRLIERAA